MKIALDRIDSEIVTALQNNARLSNKELARLVNLAPSTCLGRVKRLLADGVLTSFHAVADPKALGVGLQAMVSARLKNHDRESFEALHKHMMSREEVVALYIMAGRDDFLIHVAARDTDHLREFVVEEITTTERVQHIETSLIFEYHPRHQLPNYREFE